MHNKILKSKYKTKNCERLQSGGFCSIKVLSFLIKDRSNNYHKCSINFPDQMSDLIYFEGI